MNISKYLLLVSFIFCNITGYTQSEANRWKQGIITDEFIYDSIPAPSVHAATISDTPSGLVAAFFGGEFEGHPDVSIYVSRHTPDGWTTPRIVAGRVPGDTLQKACYNPVLYYYPDGELLLFYKRGKNVQDWSGYLIRSKDDGRTWSQPETLPDGFLGPIKNRPELIDGILVCPSSTENDGWQVHMEFTPDRGKAWTKTSPINSKPWNIIQPSILKIDDNKLQAVCRSQNEHLISSFSYDKGKTWSDPVALYLPNNNSGTDAVTLSNGQHVLVYNHVKAVLSAYVDKARTPLNIALSQDGITWKAALVLEDSHIKEYSYPSVIQGNDGMIHIVYTWRREKIKYVKIDPSLLQTSSITRGEWPEK